MGTYTYDALNRNTAVTYTNDPNSTPAVNRYYDGWRAGANQNIANSKGRLWQTESSGSAGSRATINGYDALGRPLSESQQFYVSGAFEQSYTTQRGYNLAGAVTSQTYPSGRIVNYSYDNAGRTASFSGNLGDGTQRSYSTEILYSPLGGMTKEKFGTDTALYNKLFYNARGQLAEIRAGTTYTGPDDSSWNRGAIINHYSNNCWGACGGSNSSTAMTDNNGNLKKQEVYIPNNDQLPVTSYTQWWQGYEYDALNRLQRVHEYTGNTQTEWQQEYVYDRFGNRTIHQTNTSGPGINKKDFTVNTANNRLGVPGGQSGVMSYDNAGNLIADTYSGSAVSRAFDAENRMTSETQGGSLVAGAYTYNADGQRVRRNVSGVETWNIYGFDGELLAEYAANANVASPQKEYGYRNGQLLITVDAPATARTNFALSSNGTIASASSSYSGCAASGGNDGDRKGMNYGQNTTWGGATATFPQWLQMDFNGTKTIDEIDVFTLQDNYQNPSEPTEAMTFSLHGVTGFEVQYWSGSAWVTVTGGNISSNNKVWRKLSFSAITTSKIRVVTNASSNSWSEITELEAWGNAVSSPVNVARSSNGATASASSSYAGLAASGGIDGDRKGLNYGQNTSWAGATATFPQWLEVDFSGSKTINEIDVFTLQDNYQSPSEPTEAMTFSLHGVTGFEVQYWSGSAWVTVTGGNISSNNKVWRKLSFSAITTSKIRVVTNASSNGWSEVTELEAWTATDSSANINWLVTDQLGTPRMIFDKTGSLANTKRHDYAPFGEELFNGARTTTMGYAADGVRQKFTLKERDIETGLDLFGARYYGSTQGRFTSPDPMTASARATRPQSWNRYAYCYNNPARFVDPDGMDIQFLNQQATGYLLGTLPEDIRDRVKDAIKDGTLKAGTLDEISSKDQNFLDLKEIVDNKSVTEVTTDSGFKNPGEDRQEFYFKTAQETKKEFIDGYAKDPLKLGNTREGAEALANNMTFQQEGTFGYMQRPDQSPSGNLRIIVSDGTGAAAKMPLEERVGTMGHELYVHGRLYLAGKPFGHGDKGGPTEAQFTSVEARSKRNFRGSPTTPSFLKPRIR